MSEKKPKLERITSPKGTAKWPFLSTPDSRFAKADEAPDYKVNLLLTPAEAQPLIEKLTPMVDAAFADAQSKVKPVKRGSLTKHFPWTEETDKEGNTTGKLEFKFKSKAWYVNDNEEKVDLKPKLFDGFGQPLTKKMNIGNGSLIRVNFCPKEFFSAANNSAGVSLMLNAVQVIKLVEYGGGSAGDYGFGSESDAEPMPPGDDLAEDGQREPAGPAGKSGDF